MVKRLASHDHHSKILRGADGLRGSTVDIIKIYRSLRTPYHHADIIRCDECDINNVG